MSVPHITETLDWPRNSDTPEQFSEKAEAAGLKLNPLGVQMNELGDFMNDRADHADQMADEAEQSATEAQGWAAAAQNAANVDATLWDPALYYSVGACVFVAEAGFGGTIYRRIVEGQTATKPYLDRANWDPIDVSQYGWGSTLLATYTDANALPGRNMRGLLENTASNLPLAIACVVDQVHVSDTVAIQTAYAVDGTDRQWQRIKTAGTWAGWRLESNLNMHSVTTTGACNLREAAYFVISVTGATTITITNAFGGNKWAQFFEVELVFGATLSAITWPANVRWPNGVTPAYAVNRRFKVGLEWSPSAQLWQAAYLGGY